MSSVSNRKLRNNSFDICDLFAHLFVNALQFDRIECCWRNCVENVLFLHAHLDERRRSVNDQPALHLRLLWLELFDFYVQRILKFLIPFFTWARPEKISDSSSIISRGQFCRLQIETTGVVWILGWKMTIGKMPSGVMVGNYCGFLTIWCVSKDPSSPPLLSTTELFFRLFIAVWWITFDGFQ